jgi:hypothetical protein
MRRLPRAITGLIFYLLVFFNLERITLQDTSIIDIKGFVYVLLSIFVVLILQVNFVRRQPAGVLLLSASILYLIGKFFVFYYFTNWDENTIYLIITEISLIWIGILIARIAGAAMVDFQDAVESITFSHLEKAKDISAAQSEIQTEFYRSRRYNYPLTLIVVQPDTNPLEYNPHIAVREIQQSMLGRYATVSLVRELSNNLRLLDTVIDLKDNMRFAILSPQTEEDKAENLINRINNIANNMGISVTCGHATFPKDALTFEELLRSASDHMRFPLVPNQVVNFEAKDENQSNR